MSIESHERNQHPAPAPPRVAGPACHIDRICQFQDSGCIAYAKRIQCMKQSHSLHTKPWQSLAPAQRTSIPSHRGVTLVKTNTKQFTNGVGVLHGPSTALPLGESETHDYPCCPANMSKHEAIQIKVLCWQCWLVAKMRAAWIRRHDKSLINYAQSGVAPEQCPPHSVAQTGAACTGGRGTNPIECST
eukprot:1136313-Pelagomonas_calceolata.AAC.9